MASYKAIEIIRTFSVKELKRFDDFLNSPFHNKNTKVVTLFRIIKKHHPLYPQEEISKHKLSEKIFGEGNYKESYIRNLYSDLNLLVEKFLLSIHLTSDSHSDILIIRELNNRNISSLTKKKLKAFDMKIGRIKIRDIGYYEKRIFLYDMNALLKSDKSLSDKYLSQSISNKIKLSLLTIFESYFQFAVEEQRINVRHNFDYLKNSLQYISMRSNEFNDAPFLMSFYHLWMSYFDTADREHFHKAEKILRKYFSHMEHMDRKNIYSIIQTICLKKIESGEVYFEKILYNTLEEILAENVTSHRKNSINLNLYRNVLISYFKQNDKMKLKKFISTYIGNIRSESRKDILLYSDAHMHFLEKNFNTISEICNRIKYDKILGTTNENLFFKNDIKALLLKTYYELNLFELLFHHIDAYKHFLGNSKLMKDTLKEKYFQLILNVSELAKLKTEFDEFRYYKMEQKLKKENNIIDQKWICEKLLDLKRK